LYNFPNIAIPEKDKKKEEYYKSWAQAVCNASFTSDWALGYTKMKMLYDFFLFGTGSNVAGFLTTTPDGSPMPGIWTSQNTVKTRIRQMIGELEERSYIIKCRAINPEAQARKFEERERLRVKRKLQGLVQAVEEQTGIALESPEYVPQSDEELREYMDLSWKDKHVLILEGALKWLAFRNEDDETRKRAFLDQMISNISPARVEIVDGLPVIRGIDPLKFGYDRTCSDDLLRDAGYFYEFQYVPLATVAQRYGLNEKELNEVYATYTNNLSPQGFGADVPYAADWGCMPNQCNRWYMNESGVAKALVVKIVWRDYKTFAHKSETKEEYGTEFFQDVTDVENIRERDKEKIVYNKLEIWREATLIGGNYLREWGECKNQARDRSSLHRSQAPYVVWKNEHFQGNTSSMVEQLISLQTLKDMTLYQLQVQTARAHGKVLVIDAAMLPDGQFTENTFRMLKAEGLVVVNSKEYQGMSGNMNLFKDYDMALSQSVEQLIRIAAYYDDQMSMMSGMSPERMGTSEATNQTTGTTTARIVQSNLNTAVFFKGFERWWSRALQMEARLVRICMADKEKFSPIIGDVGIDFLKDNYDIDLDEFDVIAQSLPPESQDRQTIIGLVNLAVQNQEMTALDAMDIIREPDLTQAIRMYQRKTRLRQRQAAQQAQAQAEEEARQAQEDRQWQAQEADKDRNSAMATDKYKADKGVEKQKIGGRTRILQDKIRLYDK